MPPALRSTQQFNTASRERARYHNFIVHKQGRQLPGSLARRDDGVMSGLEAFYLCIHGARTFKDHGLTPTAPTGFATSNDAGSAHMHLPRV